MGNTNSNNAELAQAVNLDRKQLHVLDGVFRDLAARSPGKTIDKRTFLTLFNLPGMLGERLFTVFDTKNTDVIDYDEFMEGIRYFMGGTMDRKLNLLFQMYDLAGDGVVSPEELKMMLHSLLETPHSLFDEKTNSEEPSIESSAVVDDIVAQAIRECDVSGDGKLNFQEFREFTKTHPEVLVALENVFLIEHWVGGDVDENDDDFQAMKGERGEHENMLKSVVGCSVCEWRGNNCFSCGKALLVSSVAKIECKACKISLTMKQCMQCGCALKDHSEEVEELVGDKKRAIAQKNLILCEGYLFKIGQRMKQWKQRWFVVRGSFLYTYREKGDPRPDSVTMLEGCFIEECASDDYAKQGYYGFEIIGATDHKRTLFATSPSEKRAWMKLLREASKSVLFQERFSLGKKLGHGKFSVVHLATSLSTYEKFAVKVIDKSKMDADPQAKEALRTEIAILRLVNHPHVIRMFEVFESRLQMYIVMSLVKGGDLFDRIILRKRFGEEKTRIVIFRLLSSVKYLHDRGIVHRDLKPENILCVDEDDDTNILIADFGLSKFANPSEIMNLPCGTLAYVAPEVLKLQGYDKKVDIWSIGVIMYLLIRGALPFDGRSKSQIIRRTLHEQLTFNHDAWKACSSDCINLVNALLCKDPVDRPSMQEALAHPFFSALDAKQRLVHNQHKTETSSLHLKLITGESSFGLPSSNKTPEEGDGALAHAASDHQSTGPIVHADE